MAGKDEELEGIEGGEAIEEAKEARRHQKKKRREKRMSLPQVLRYLTGDEVLELMDYLMEKHIRWVNEVETLRYTQAFNVMLQQYLSQPQQEQQTQTQTQQEITIPQPRNPLEAMLFSYVSKIADRVIGEILSDPRFQEEIRNIIRATVSGMAQAYAEEAVKQQLPQ